MPPGIPLRFPDDPDDPFAVEPGRDGGGGTTLFVPREARREVPEADPPALPEPETEGGGGITFDAPGEDGDRPEGERPLPPPDRPPRSPTTSFHLRLRMPSVAADPAEELREVAEELPAVTVGGGGTTSCVPKSLPIRLLTSDPLFA